VAHGGCPMANWNALYQNLALSISPDRCVSKPDPLVLSSFEKTFQCQLPAVYKAFIAAFGPGTLSVVDSEGNGIDYRFLSRDGEGNPLDMTELNHSIRVEIASRSHERLPPWATHRELLQRIVWFAENYCGDLFGWVLETASPSPVAFPVYCWDRATRMVELLSDSLLVFLETVLCGHGYLDRFLGEDAAPPVSERFFTPVFKVTDAE
jgi:hypothetical protein